MQYIKRKKRDAAAKCKVAQSELYEWDQLLCSLYAGEASVVVFVTWESYKQDLKIYESTGVETDVIVI